MILCPCCRRSADLRPEALAFAIGATGLQSRILTAVWRGKGQPVHHDQIMRAMSNPDEDGPADTYLAFKVALCHLRKRLRGTGFRIENVHYGCGYRLVRDRQKDDPTFRAEAVAADAEQRAA